MPERSSFSNNAVEGSVFGKKKTEQALTDQESGTVAEQPAVPFEVRKQGKKDRWQRAVALSLALHAGGAEAAAGFPVTKALVNATHRVGGSWGEGAAFAEGAKDGKGERKVKEGDWLEGGPSVAEVHRRIVEASKKSESLTIPEWGMHDVSFESRPDGTVALAENAYWKVDFRQFFLKHEERYRVVTSAEARELSEGFHAEVLRYQALLNEAYKAEPDIYGEARSYKPELKVLHEILSDQGDYNGEQPFFGKGFAVSRSPEDGKVRVDSKGGDCKFRNKRALAFVVEVFKKQLGDPGMNIRLQVSNDPHVRPVVQLGETWYVMEGEIPYPLSKDEVDGRVFADPGSYLASEFDLARDVSVPPTKESPDRVGGGGRNDGFDLLPAGVRPTKNVFGFIPPSIKYQKFVKKSFDEARGGHKASLEDLEVVYVDMTDEQEKKFDEEAKKPDRKMFEPYPIALSENQVMTGKIAGELSFGGEIGQLFNTAEPSNLSPDMENRIRAFKQLPAAEQERYVRGTTIDLSALQDMPIQRLVIAGGRADLRQLHNVSSLRTFSSSHAYVLGMDTLEKAASLESFSWRGDFYAAAETRQVEEEFRRLFHDKKNLVKVTIKDSPLTHAHFLDGVPVQDLELENLNIADVSFLNSLSHSKNIRLTSLATRDLSPLKTLLDAKPDLNVVIQKKYGDSVYRYLDREEIKKEGYITDFFPPNFNYRSHY